MNLNSDELWADILDSTTPGHYGFDDVEFDIDLKDIWVDIQKGTFSFKRGWLSFSARMGASSERDGVDVKCRNVVSGDGRFEFATANTIKVLAFTINEPIDLYGE
jgi:hypothetical protein